MGEQSTESDALAKALFAAFPGIPAPGPFPGIPALGPGAWKRVWREQAEALVSAGWQILPPARTDGGEGPTSDQRQTEKAPFGPNPGKHRDNCDYALQQHNCSCEYPRYVEAVEHVAQDLVRSAVERALENEDPGWEDYPDLPEFVWDDVRARARYLADSHTDIHSSDAHKALSALATEEA